MKTINKHNHFLYEGDTLHRKQSLAGIRHIYHIVSHSLPCHRYYRQNNENSSDAQYSHYICSTHKNSVCYYQPKSVRHLKYQEFMKYHAAVLFHIWEKAGD